MGGTGSPIQQQDPGFGIVAKPLGPYLEFFAKTLNFNKFYIARLDTGILLGKINLCINYILTALLARKNKVATKQMSKSFFIGIFLNDSSPKLLVTGMKIIKKLKTKVGYSLRGNLASLCAVL
jgi:hypothetical protein